MYRANPLLWARPRNYLKPRPYLQGTLYLQSTSYLQGTTCSQGTRYKMLFSPLSSRNFVQLASICKDTEVSVKIKGFFL